MNALRMRALDLANERRRERVEYRLALQEMHPVAARRHAARLLTRPSPMMRSLELMTLLAWLPQLGRSSPGGRAGVVDRLFAHLGVRAVDKRIGELTDRQRGLLIDWLENGR